MKKIALFFYYLIQFTWGLPQNIVGLILTLAHSKNVKEFFHGALVTYHNEDWGGISLGMFILMNGNRDETWSSGTRVHEFGHTIQSLILGPLYLFVIGLPSIIWCNGKKFIKMRKEDGVSYFSFYPEKWANHLGSKITHLPAPTK